MQMSTLLEYINVLHWILYILVSLIMDYNNYVTRFAKPTMYALGYIC